MVEMLCNFLASKELWEKFKKVAKENDSDASKELRKFMKAYVKRKEKTR